MRNRTGTTATALLVACLGAGLGGTAFAQTNTGNSRTQPGYESAQPNPKAAPQFPEQSPSGGEEAPPAHWAPVLIVTGVEVLRSSLAPQLEIVRVHGLSSTGGWESPELLPLT